MIYCKNCESIYETALVEHDKEENLHCPMCNDGNELYYINDDVGYMIRDMVEKNIPKHLKL